jgi:tRNA A-37 threonylcarbamoyl transferase component Bud32
LPLQSTVENQKFSQVVSFDCIAIPSTKTLIWRFNVTYQVGGLLGAVHRVQAFHADCAT